VLLGGDSDLIRRQMSSDSMVSVCSSGGSQQSSAGDAGSDKKKKPRVWVIELTLVSINLDSVNSVVPGTRAQQLCTTILNCEVLCSIGR